MAETSQKPTANINWKLLMRRLERQKAVLFLGPEVPMAFQDEPVPIKQALQEHVHRDLKELLQEDDLRKIEYYQEDGFFHLEDDYKSDIIYPIVEFYKDLPLTEVHQKLVQLPFHMILSLSPDDLISRAMKALNLPHHFHFYDKRHYNKEKDDAILNFTPTLQNRLVYNIFGSIDHEDSMILSYDDLFEFVQKIFNNYHLPEVVRETVIDANCFVFIGFNYGTWYLKLLLRLLNLQEKVKLVYGMDSPSSQEIETFFINEFDMNFTQMNTRNFIEELYEKCAEADLLIKPGQGGHSDKISETLKRETIRLVSNDQMDQALTQLLKQGEKGELPTELNNHLVQLSARYHSLKRDDAKGILDYRDYTVQRNRIMNDLLELINQYS